MRRIRAVEDRKKEVGMDVVKETKKAKLGCGSKDGGSGGGRQWYGGE